MVFSKQKWQKKYMRLYSKALNILRNNHVIEFRKIFNKLKGGLENGKRK